MSKANVAVTTPETRSFENEGNTTARRYNDEAAHNGKDVGSEAEEIGRAEEEGMCHPTGPGKSQASN